MNEEIIKMLKEEGTPRNAFKQNLKKQVLAEYSRQPNFIQSVIMAISFKQKALLGAVSALVLTGALASGGYVYYANMQPNISEDVLAQIAENYSQQNSQNQNGKRSATDARLASSTAEIMLYRPPVNRDYNYQVRRDTFTFGNSYNKCTPLVPVALGINTVEYTEWYKKKDDWQAEYSESKTISEGSATNSQGLVKDYTLTAGTTRWEYRGGSYAVKVINTPRYDILATARPANVAEGDTAISVPAPDNQASTDAPQEKPATTQTPAEKIKSIFGEDAKVIGQITKNGKKYYRIQWSFQATCEVPENRETPVGASDYRVVDLEKGNKKVIMQALANQSTMEIEEESMFLENVNNNFLIFTKNAQVERKTIDEAEAKSRFTFPFNVPVKELDQKVFDSGDYFINQMKSYLQQKNISVLKPLAADFTITGLSSSSVEPYRELSKHLTDRAFYSPGAEGTKQYEEIKKGFVVDTSVNMNNPALRIHTENAKDMTAYTGMTISVFQNLSADKLFEELKASRPIRENPKTTVTIDGQKVEAREIFGADVSKSSRTEPGSAGAEQTMPAPEEEFATRYFIFTYKGNVHLIEITGKKEKVNATVLNFSAAQPGSSSLQNILNAIKQRMDSNKPVIAY
jgi:hypothetical protein